MNQFKKSGKLGYWALHCNGTLQFHSNNCHGVNPELMFQGWHWLGWWHVRCELDWYRMNKEAAILKEGPLEPLVA